MPVAKKVISYSSESWIRCAWFECEKPGFELYKSVLHEHGRGIPCEQGDHVNFVFCSERHRQLYRHSHVEFGKLPPGFKKTF